MGLLLFKKKKDSKDPMFNIGNGYPDFPKNYKLLEILGEGAFSTVYKVENTVNGKYYAMKIINKDSLSEKQLNNIQNEINIMKNLHHQNVLKLHQFYNHTDYCYLVLEYCNGGEVFNKIIEYTYFSEQLSRHVFLQVLRAVNYLHQNNVVHRDIKPENLFFNKVRFLPRSHDEFVGALRASDDDNKVDEGKFVTGYGAGTIGVIKLGDFGLAKRLAYTNPVNKSNLNSTVRNNLKTPCGTAGYTAPEVITVNQDIDKENYYSKAVDIWSLGCFLYTILCGFPPFYDDDSNKLTMKILNGDYTFLSPWWDDISLEAKDLISKMLIINPNNRITIDEILDHPWVKEETFSDDYFNVNSRFENDNKSSIPVKPSEHVEHVEHVEHIERPDDSDSDAASRNQTIQGTPGSTSGVVIPNGVNLASDPRAGVHLNDDDDLHSLDSEDPLATSRQPSPFAQSHSNAIPIPLTTPSLLSVNGGTTDPLLSPRATAIKSVFNNPAMNDFSNLKFSNRNIFNIKEEGKDVLTDLSHLTIKSSANSSNSSSNSNEDDNLNDNYQTRQSSIISNNNGGNDKFQLNMNDSNIIMRRKSTLKKD